MAEAGAPTTRSNVESAVQIRMSSFTRRPSVRSAEVDEVVGRGEVGLGEDTKRMLQRFTKNTRTVEKADVIRFVEEKQMERNSFGRLPFTIFFFVVYSMAILNHENVTDSGMVQREMRSMLEGTTFEGVQYTSGHKDMSDIDTKEDVYNYVREAVIPNFLNDKNSGKPEEDMNRVLRYNQLIGGLVLQQTRRKTVNCAKEYPNLGPFRDDTEVNPLLIDFSCYPWYSESEDCFGVCANENATNPCTTPGWCTNAKFFADSVGGRRLDFVPDGGGTGGSSKGARMYPTADQLYSAFLYSFDGIADATQKVNDLQANGWIDDNTAWFGIRMLILNPDLAIFVHITMSVYMSPSGAMLPKVDAQSFQPEPYQYMSVVALDVLFLLCVFWLTISVLREIYHHARKPHGGWLYITNLWNFLDLANVIFSVVLIFLWLILLDKLTEGKEKAMASRAVEPKSWNEPMNPAYPESVQKMHEEFDNVVSYLSMWRIMLTFYTITLAMKFLESFDAQPRLAVVTKTIKSAGSDLFHFGIVITTIFFAYCVAGMFLFGRRMWTFSSEPTTMSTCFLMMLGDFDWEELAWEHPLTAGLWFWTYMIVMQTLMLNMLMAIIMDVYTQVKSDANEFAPVWVQIYELAVDAYNTSRGRTVSNAELLEVLHEMPEDDVDENVLVKRVGPGLSLEQARKIMDSTREKVDHELNKGVTMSEAMRMIGWVKITVQKIGWKLEQIVDEEKDEQDAIVGDEIGTRRRMGTSGGDPKMSSRNDKSIEDEPKPEEKTAYVADASDRMDEIDIRLSKIESFMQESLQYTTFRGKDLRNRLAVIEDLVRNQRDIVVRDTADLWDQMPNRLGGSNLASNFGPASQGSSRNREPSPITPRLPPMQESFRQTESPGVREI
mmetsp:Transcript_24764/g.39762  ORF Transcript_24764/g.39762 Transcript_24764/m.39762 type:complete len:891 (+) Transcript_24764:3-2675(+)